MAKEVLCPTCGAKYNLAEEQLGKKLRCKKCEHTFTAGGEARRREEDDDEDLQTAPRPRPRATAGKGRDRDDDDRPRKHRSLAKQARPRAPKGSGVPVGPIVIACVAVGVLVLCGGGGVGLWYFWSSAGPPPNPPVVQRPANPPFLQPRPGADANPPGQAVPPGQMPPVVIFPPGRPGGRFGGARDVPPIDNMKEALDAVHDNDVVRRWAGADWLSRAVRDEAQAVEVSKALDPLVRNAQPDVFGHDPPRQGALKALKVWGTKENVPTLVQFLQTEKGNIGAPVHMQDQLKDAMTDLARIGDDRGVEGILPWVGDFFIGTAAEAALRELGPKGEKGLARYYNDPNEGRRKLARGLLQEFNTKPEVILAAVAADLRTGDAGHPQLPVGPHEMPDDFPPFPGRAAPAGRRRLAAESLNSLPLVEALREEMSKALNFALDDPDRDVAAAGLKAAKTWGTRENLPALLRHVGEGGQLNTQREAAMEALAALKDERGVWPVARWLGDPFNGQGAEAAIPKFGPVAEKVALEHLKDADAPSRLQAWRALALVGTKANVAAMNAAGLKEGDANNRTAAAAAIRSAQMRQ